MQNDNNSNSNSNNNNNNNNNIKTKQSAHQNKHKWLKTTNWLLGKRNNSLTTLESPCRLPSVWPVNGCPGSWAVWWLVHGAERMELKNNLIVQNGWSMNYRLVGSLPGVGGPIDDRTVLLPLVGPVRSTHFLNPSIFCVDVAPWCKTIRDPHLPIVLGRQNARQLPWCEGGENCR